MPVHLDRPATSTRLQRTVTASTTVSLASDDIIFADASATNIAVTMPNPGGDLAKIFTIKRIDGRADTYVYITSTGGVDNDDNDIALTPTAQGGIDSGESVDMVWDGVEWRVLGSLQNTTTNDTGLNWVCEGTRTVAANSVHWTNRIMVIGKGYQPGGAINGFISINLPAVGTAIPKSTGGTVAVTANGIPLGSFESLYYRYNQGIGDEGFIVVPYNDNYRDNELAVWIATNVGNVRMVWGDYQIGSDPDVAADFWRASGVNGELPDGVQDYENWISHQGRVGIGQQPVYADGPIAWLDVAAANRSGTDGRVDGQTPFYVTGNLPGLPGTSTVGPTPTGGVEFRHSNQTQGVGIGFNGIYATGSVANQDFYIMQRGAGQVDIKHQALLGGFNYLNHVGPAVGNNQGWQHRWYAAGSQQFGEILRRDGSGVDQGERFWQQRGRGGTYVNAMRLGAASPFVAGDNTSNGDTTLWVAENTVHDRKLALYGAGVPSAFYGFGMEASTLLSIVPNGVSMWRWRRGNDRGLAMEVRGDGRVLMPGLPTSAAGLPSGALWRDVAGQGTLTNVVRMVP